MKSRALWVAALVLFPSLGQARPVPVGRYVEIPYGVSEGHPWRTGGGDPRRTHRSEHRAPESAPTQQWTARVGVGRVFSPTIAEDGTIYVASQRGVAAVAADGTVRWERAVGLVSGTPSITPDGGIAFGTQPDELLVLRQGSARSRARIGGGVRGSPLVLDDGSIVLAAYDQAIHRFDADGRRMFRTPVTTQVRGTVARSGDLLVVPAGRELLWISVRGTIVRTTSLGSSIELGPAVADDGVAWVVTAEGVLVAVTPAGRVVVRTDLDARPSRASNLAIADDGSLRLGTADAGLLCIGAGGTERWRLTDRGTLAGEVIVDADGVALLVNSDGAMLAVEPDGDVRWQASLGTRTDAAPVLGADGTIYTTTFGGTLQAWRYSRP
ncbi:MAG: PQQ-binding-like beta-propeller repeat protein [Myxococcota bacterium]